MSASVATPIAHHRAQAFLPHHHATKMDVDRNDSVPGNGGASVGAVAAPASAPIIDPAVAAPAPSHSRATHRFRFAAPGGLLSSLRHRSQSAVGSWGLRGRLADPSPWLLRDLSCHYDDVHSLTDPFASELAPSFCVRYHPSAASSSLMHVADSSNEGALIVAADEQGWVSFLHSNTPGHEQDAQVRHKFQAHQNAIFDFAFLDAQQATHSGHVSAAGERTGAVCTQIVTVSGDQKACGWDINTSTCLFKLAGHKASVKTIQAQPGQPHVLVTGSRDGNVRLFDVREHMAGTADPTSPPRGDDLLFPCYTLKNVQTESAWKAKRKRVAEATVPDSFQSVTSLQFLSPHVLLTAGAANACIKAWDLRYMKSKFSRDSIILPSARSPTGSFSSSSSRRKKDADRFESLWEIDHQRAHAISSLALDPSGTRLLASSTDHAVHLYDLFDTSNPSALLPQQTFIGHTGSSFYIKSAFSPCGRFITSGSVDHKIYVWDSEAYKRAPLPAETADAEQSGEAAPSRSTSACVRPLKVLSGHAGEVSQVSWSPHTLDHCRFPFQLASCSDDSTVRVWNVDRTEREEKCGEVFDLPPSPKPRARCLTPKRSPHTPAPGTLFVNPPRLGHDARRRLFADAAVVPIDAPLVSAASAATSMDADSVSSAPTPLSPRRDGDSDGDGDDNSSPSDSASATVSANANTDESGVCLVRRLRSHLTVSPSKVRLAQEAHSATRRRQRDESAAAAAAAALPAAATVAASMETDERSGLTDTAAVTAVAASPFRPTSLHFGAATDLSACCSGARLVAVGGGSLPLLRADGPRGRGGAAAAAVSSVQPTNGAPSTASAAVDTAAVTAAASFTAAAAAAAAVTPMAALPVPSPPLSSLSALHRPFPSSLRGLAPVAVVPRVVIQPLRPTSSAADTTAIPSTAASTMTPRSSTPRSNTPRGSASRTGSSSASAKKNIKVRKIQDFFVRAPTPSPAGNKDAAPNATV